MDVQLLIGVFAAIVATANSFAARYNNSRINAELDDVKGKLGVMHVEMQDCEEDRKRIAADLARHLAS